LIIGALIHLQDVYNKEMTAGRLKELNDELFSHDICSYIQAPGKYLHLENGALFIRFRRNEMSVSKAQQKAVNKYVRDNYDRVNVNMPKGKKDEIKTHAEARGESVNAFINRAIDETMSRDKK
jgi:hypothetical protein